MAEPDGDARLSADIAATLRSELPPGAARLWSRRVTTTGVQCTATLVLLYEASCARLALVCSSSSSSGGGGGGGGSSSGDAGGGAAVRGCAHEEGSDDGDDDDAFDFARR